MKSKIIFLYCAVSFATTLSVRANAQGNFPSVDPVTQRARDDTRRQILQTELTTEKKALEDAQLVLAEATKAKQPTIKLDQLRQDAERYAKNIVALNNELAATGSLSGATKAATSVRLSGRTTNSSSDATQRTEAPFWDVYRRTQVRVGSESASTDSP